MKARSRALAALLSAACCLATAGGQAGAAAPGRLEAAYGFGGYAAPARWNPLWIRCEGGTGSASIEVVKLARDGRELGSETFPLPAGQRLECPVSADVELETISVRLRSSDSILAEAKIGARSKIFPGHIVLACGLSARARLAIASALMPSEPLQAVAVEARDFPANGLDYDCVSAIAIGDAGLRLSPAQREALLAWLAGGGRLALPAEGSDREFLLSSLGIAGPGEGASWAEFGFGLGSVARMAVDPPGSAATEARAEVWRASLALRPYGEKSRIDATGVARWSRADGTPTAAVRKARAILVAAVAAWLAASLGAILLGRGKARGAWAVAALCLGFIFAGRASLDAVLMRGASARALALVLPDSGSAIVAASFVGPSPAPAFEWARAEALAPLSVAYAGGDEGGQADPAAFGRTQWSHRLPKASFSLRAVGSDELALSALVGARALEGSSLPALRRGSYPRGGGGPPELDSAWPMAFVGAGAAAGGEKVLWWGKEPGGAWARLERVPAWLEADEQWILGLRDNWPPWAFLVGRGPAPALGLSVAGAPIGELCWALPLPPGPAMPEGGG